MNTKDCDISCLLILAQQKLKLLEQLHNGYLRLFDLLSVETAEDAVVVFDDHEKILRQIDQIDRRFKPLYATINTRVIQKESNNYLKLNQILASQKEFLTEISRLNENLILKGESIKLSLESNIKQVNRQKNILNRYYSSNGRHGFLLDYKEGK